MVDKVILDIEGAPQKSRLAQNFAVNENPQLLSNLYETWWKYSSQEYSMLLEYHLDWIKIVDFLLIAKFWASPDNYLVITLYYNFFGLGHFLTHDILKNRPKNDRNQKVIGSKN